VVEICKICGNAFEKKVGNQIICSNGICIKTHRKEEWQKWYKKIKTDKVKWSIYIKRIHSRNPKIYRKKINNNNCLFCGKSLIDKKYGVIFCSKKCRLKHRNRYYKKVKNYSYCLMCGKKFIQIANKKNCNKKCQHEYKIYHNKKYLQAHRLEHKNYYNSHKDVLNKNRREKLLKLKNDPVSYYLYKKKVRLIKLEKAKKDKVKYQKYIDGQISNICNNDKDIKKILRKIEYNNNSDKYREISKKWARKNKDKVNHRKRELYKINNQLLYHRKYIINNYEKYKKYTKEYRLKNKNKLLEKSVLYGNYKTSKKNIPILCRKTMAIKRAIKHNCLTPQLLTSIRNGRTYEAYI
jgi:hypothetical protein